MNVLTIKKINSEIIIEDESKKKLQKPTYEIIKTFNFLDLNGKNINDKEAKRIVGYIARLLRDKKSDELFNQLYNKLLIINDRESLEILFLEALDIINIKSTIVKDLDLKAMLIKDYNTCPDETLNMFACQIIKEYYNIVTKKISNNNLTKLDKILQSNKDDQKALLESIGLIEENFNQKSLYQLSVNAIKTSAYNRIYKSDNHLCFNCYTKILECPKLLDKEKKYLMSYDFITDGKQTFNKSGEMTHFIVTKCLKYKNKKQ